MIPPITILPTRPMNDDQIEALAVIPGFKVKPGYLRIPFSTFAVAKAACARLGVEFYSVSVPEGVPTPESRKPIFAAPDLLTGIDYRSFQTDGIEFACAREGAHLWHPCGAGKTLQGLTWITQADGAAVVVTKAGARPTYRREFRKFTTIQPYILSSDSPESKQETLVQYVERTRSEGRRPVVVTSYEALAGNVGDLINIVRPVSVLYDEIHKIKQSKRSRSITRTDGSTERRALGNMSDCAARLARVSQRRLGTSRTPIPDRVRDLWSPLDVTNPGDFGRYWDFASRYCDLQKDPVHGFMNDKGKSNLKELKHRLAFYAHVVQQSQLAAELPPVSREVVYIPAECLDRAASMAEDVRRAKKSPHILAHIKLLAAASRKRSWIVDKASEGFASGQKWLILTGRVHEVTALCDALRKANPDVPIWRSHDHNVITTTAMHEGTELSSTRENTALVSEEVRDSRRGEYMAHVGAAVFVGTIESVGESMDFQDTDVLCMAMLSFRPKDIQQAEGRVVRIGQVRATRILYAVAEGTADEHVAAHLLAKLPAIGMLTGDTDVDDIHDELEGLRDEVGLRKSMVGAILGRSVDDEEAVEIMED